MKVSADCEGDAREPKQSFMAKHKQTNELPAQDLCFWFNAQASYSETKDRSKESRRVFSSKFILVILYSSHSDSKSTVCTCYFSVPLWPSSLITHWPFSTTLPQHPRPNHTGFSEPFPKPLSPSYRQKLNSHSRSRTAQQETNKRMHRSERLFDNGVKDWKNCWLWWDGAIWMNHTSRRFFFFFFMSFSQIMWTLIRNTFPNIITTRFNYKIVFDLMQDILFVARE